MSAVSTQKDALKLHRDLVAIPSLSRQEAAASDHLEAWFRARDIDVVRYGDNVVASAGDDAGPEGGPSGAAPRTLLVNSHLDVVPPSADHPFPPFDPVVHDGAVWGRGSVDAKGCVAAMAGALVAWSRRKRRSTGRVLGAFTTCEELGGAENGLEEILPRLGTLHAALVGEPTGMQPCTAQKGLLILKLVARGRTAHAARAGEGENAIVKASEAVRLLESLQFAPDDPLLGPVTCVPTVIEGGSARNVVPDACTVWLDIRSTPTWPHDRILAHVTDKMGALVDVHVHSDRLYPMGTAEAEDIVQACIHGARRDGQAPFGSPTVSDWVHLGRLPAVKIGPGDSRLSHTPREHLPIAELEEAIFMYADIMEAYHGSVSRTELIHYNTK